MESTGVSGREFLEEMRERYNVLLAKTGTPKDECVARVVSRVRGRHVNDHDESAAGSFFDYWHREIAPTYRFTLSVSGTDLCGDVQLISSACEA